MEADASESGRPRKLRKWWGAVVKTRPLSLQAAPAVSCSWSCRSLCSVEGVQAFGDEGGAALGGADLGGRIGGVAGVGALVGLR